MDLVGPNREQDIEQHALRLRAKLDEVSAPILPYPYGMFTDEYQATFVHAGAVVEKLTQPRT